MTSTEQSSLSLLLLRRVPSPTTLANFRSIYAQPIVESLEKLSQITKSTPVIQTLDIVIPFPGLNDNSPRSAQYADLQDIVCQLYRLLCVICIKHSIDVENGNYVEIRIVPLGMDTGNPRSLGLQPLIHGFLLHVRGHGSDFSLSKMKKMDPY